MPLKLSHLFLAIAWLYALAIYGWPPLLELPEESEGGYEELHEEEPDDTYPYPDTLEDEVDGYWPADMADDHDFWYRDPTVRLELPGDTTLYDEWAAHAEGNPPRLVLPSPTPQ